MTPTHMQLLTAALKEYVRADQAWRDAANNDTWTDDVHGRGRARAERELCTVLADEDGPSSTYRLQRRLADLAIGLIATLEEKE